MVIPIPSGINYTAKVSGSALKLVRCEKCQAAYAYILKRTSRGEGTSLLFLDNQGAQERAFERAEQRLLRRLETDCDVVPCPACGWIQAAMLPKARRARCQWMQSAGVGLLITMLILLIGGAVGIMAADLRPSPAWAEVLFWAAGGCAILGIGFLVGRLVRLPFIDPNGTDASARIKVGQARALPSEDAERLLASQESPEKAASPAATDSPPGIFAPPAAPPDTGIVERSRHPGGWPASEHLD